MKTISIIVTTVLLISCSKKESDVIPKIPEAYYISFKIVDMKFTNISYAAFAKPNDIFKPDSINNELKVDITDMFSGKKLNDTTSWFKVEAKYVEPKKEWNQGLNRFVRFYFTNNDGVKYRTMIYTFSEDSTMFSVGAYNTYFSY